MSQALAFFERNFSYSRNLLALSLRIDNLTTGALDVSDIQRAALVAGISAQDAYVHSAVRELMVATADSMRPATDTFNRFSVPMDSVAESTYLPNSIWLDRAVAQSHAHLSFQHPDKIADAIRLVSPRELWQDLGSVLNEPPTRLKTRQKLIAVRRNQIVHEADCEPTPPHDRRPINKQDVNESLDFLSDLVHAIDGLL